MLNPSHLCRRLVKVICTVVHSLIIQLIVSRMCYFPCEAIDQKQSIVWCLNKLCTKPFLHDLQTAILSYRFIEIFPYSYVKRITLIQIYSSFYSHRRNQELEKVECESLARVCLTFLKIVQDRHNIPLTILVSWSVCHWREILQHFDQVA